MDTSYFDKNALLTLVGNEHESLIELMEIGMNKLASLSDELAEAVLGGDEANIRKVAHKLNGMGRSLRMDKLRISAEKLEYLRPWESDLVPGLAEDIRADVVVVVNILRGELG
jgi:HPt (histidine-containing phosphotransfer) domain-containing protein